MTKDTDSSGRGMVVTSHPAAVAAGLEALDAGGTAADAAVTAAAVLTVVDPRSTGVGGDAFALYWEPGEPAPIAMQAAGPAPEGMSVAALREAGFAAMPEAGPWTVTVPGSVAGWQWLLERYGKSGLDLALARAIDLAVGGFEIRPVVAEEWATCTGKLRADREAERVYLVDGRPPQAGDHLRLPALGRSLGMIADHGPDVLYGGELGERIAQSVEAAGGPLRLRDLASWEGPEWVEPLAVSYREIDVYEVPPPTQGIVALQALALYRGLDVGSVDDEEHAGIECVKLAVADAEAHLADPRFENVPAEALLSEDYISRRRSAIDMGRAMWATPGRPGGTVYLAVVDAEGAACSFIQSLYEGFGSGIVAPETGIVLQNRGANFVLGEEHPNRPAPGKRPFHTIIPGMLGRSGGFFAALGVVGGFMQPQGQFQVIRNLVDRGLGPQAAVDAPRWRSEGDRRVGLERGFDARVAEALQRRGHELHELERFKAGGAQLIVRSDGKLAGGSDRRKDGVVGGG